MYYNHYYYYRRLWNKEISRSCLISYHHTIVPRPRKRGNAGDHGGVETSANSIDHQLVYRTGSYFLVCILQRNQIVRHAQPTAKYNQLVVDVKQFFIKCAHVVDPFSTVLPPMTFVCDRYCWIHAFITKSTFVWPCFLRFF